MSLWLYPSTIERKVRCDKGIRRRPARPRAFIARRLARHGLYHILQVTDPVRGRMELRYVRGYPEPLTFQLPLFSQSIYTGEQA